MHLVITAGFLGKKIATDTQNLFHGFSLSHISTRSLTTETSLKDNLNAPSFLMLSKGMLFTRYRHSSKMPATLVTRHTPLSLHVMLILRELIQHADTVSKTASLPLINVQYYHTNYFKYHTYNTLQFLSTPEIAFFINTTL